MEKLGLRKGHSGLPKPPSWEEMLEDLKQADNSDIEFLLSVNKKTELSTTLHIEDGTETLREEEKHKNERVNEAVTFIEKMDSLQSLMNTLDEKYRLLEDASEQLSITIKNVQKKASEVTEYCDF